MLKNKQRKSFDVSLSVAEAMYSESELIRTGILKSAKETFDALKIQLAKKDDF